MVYRMKILLDQRLDPLYEAVIEATEEAILNALCMARDMDGANGNVCRALPLAGREGARRALAGGARPGSRAPPAPRRRRGADGPRARARRGPRREADRRARRRGDAPPRAAAGRRRDPAAREPDGRSDAQEATGRRPSSGAGEDGAASAAGLALAPARRRAIERPMFGRAEEIDGPFEEQAHPREVDPRQKWKARKKRQKAAAKTTAKK